MRLFDLDNTAYNSHTLTFEWHLLTLGYTQVIKPTYLLVTLYFLNTTGIINFEITNFKKCITW